MGRLRRLLGPLAALWLSAQLGAIAIVPPALWISAPTAHATACSCGHGADDFCPMHHPRDGRSSRCAMQARDGSGAAIVTTLIALTGITPDSSPAPEPPAASAPVHAASRHAIGERPIPPDPPPPRR
jgi:hypothetical protein